MKRVKNKLIKILGAGISGLTAAINLAKAGYKVDVYEKAPEIGTRFHQDLQGIENWSEDIDSLKEMKNMNICLNFHCKPFKHNLYKFGESKYDSHYKKPIFYLVKRGQRGDTLDQGLKKQALNLGVKIIYNRTLPENQVDIVATGPYPSKFRGFVSGVTFKTDFKDIAVGVIDKETTKNAYSYLLVDNDYGVICSCAEMKPKDFDKLLKNAIKYFKEEYHIKLRDIKPMGGYTNLHEKRRYRIKKTLYVGEAAGLQDYLYGFGMRYAMQSGFLAADSIINNYDYKKAAQKKFEKKVKIGAVNRFLTDFDEKDDYLIMRLIFSLFKDKRGLLNDVYTKGSLKILVYPLVMRYFKKKYSLKNIE